MGWAWLPAGYLTPAQVPLLTRVGAFCQAKCSEWRLTQSAGSKHTKDSQAWTLTQVPVRWVGCQQLREAGTLLPLCCSGFMLPSPLQGCFDGGRERANCIFMYPRQDSNFSSNTKVSQALLECCKQGLCELLISAGYILTLATRSLPC